MLRLRCYRCLAERRRKRPPVVVVAPLIAEVGAVGVAALAKDNVLGRPVDVAPVHGEALRRAQGAADLFHGSAVAALRLGPGSGDAADEGQNCLLYTSRCV